MLALQRRVGGGEEPILGVLALAHELRERVVDARL
jgi:hypothetical protein